MEGEHRLSIYTEGDIEPTNQRRRTPLEIQQQVERRLRNSQLRLCTGERSENHTPLPEPGTRPSDLGMSFAQDQFSGNPL